MAKKQKSDVDVWLERETQHKREALENASKYFDKNDNLTVNTLEAIYGVNRHVIIHHKSARKVHHF